MNAAIKIALCLVLMVQFSFGEKLLVYQNADFKKVFAYLHQKPTFDQVALALALAKMDGTLIDQTKKLLKDRGISSQSRIPDIELKGNQIVIEGLAKPIVIANKYELELSYDGEKLPILKNNSLEKTLSDVESFFKKREVAYNQNSELATPFQMSALNKFWPLLIIEGIFSKKRAEAAGVAVPILVTMAAILGFGLWGMVGMMESANSADPSVIKRWLFKPENYSEPIEFECKNGHFTIVNGNERMSFQFIEHNDPDRRGLDGAQAVVFPAFQVNYSTSKKSIDQHSIVFYDDDDSVAKESSVFTSPHFTEQKKADLLALSRKVVGPDGKRQICSGNKFKYSTIKSGFETLASELNRTRKKGSSSAPTDLINLDKGREIK